MTVLELWDCLQQGAVNDENPEVVVLTRNPSVGPRACARVTGANFGFDWDKGRLLLRTDPPVVAFRHAEAGKSVRDIGRARLEVLKAAYAKVSIKYIPKSREDEWVDGFKEGFEAFQLAVEAGGKPS